MKPQKIFMPAILLLLALTVGCAVTEEPETTGTQSEYIVLRIVTESTTVDGMKSQILEMISVFEAAHENINLVLEVLPSEGLARQKAVSQIYVDIANGYGPDIYLMPNGSTVPVATGAYTTGTASPLFADVNEHMHKGTFADISEYYNADDALGKEDLLKGVMEAGMVGDARYVLPLRYSIPVIYADLDALEETILTEELLNQGIWNILQHLLSKHDYSLAVCVDPVPLHSRFLFNFFSEIIDYETCTLKLNNLRLYQYMRNANTIHQAAQQEEKAPSAPHVGSYISTGDYFAVDGFPLTLGKLESALDAAAIAKSLEIDLAMIPLKGVDGDLVADVTYFGAVGSSCTHPELAYEFLRLFLSEDCQWELNRPRSTQGFQPGLIAAGWPVRAKDAAPYLWQNLAFQLSFYVGQDDAWEQRTDALQQVGLTENDLANLMVSVDSARLNNPVEGMVNVNGMWTTDSDAYRITEFLALNMKIFREEMK